MREVSVRVWIGALILVLLEVADRLAAEAWDVAVDVAPRIAIPECPVTIGNGQTEVPGAQQIIFSNRGAEPPAVGLLAGKADAVAKQVDAEGVLTDAVAGDQQTLEAGEPVTDVDLVLGQTAQCQCPTLRLELEFGGRATIDLAGPKAIVEAI